MEKKQYIPVVKFLFFFILINFINTRAFLENSKVEIYNKTFTRTEIYLDVKKVTDEIFIMDDTYLPSDLITFLPEKTEFSIQILQGTIDYELKSQFYPFNFYNIDNLISDYPSGKIYSSENFSPFTDEEHFKKYFDVFCHTFKLTLNPFFDRSSYIIYNNSKLLLDHKEIPCNTHLDAIKETLNNDMWDRFVEYVNYTNFLKSDFKSIKYHLKNYKNKVVYKIEILSRDLNQTTNSLKTQNTNTNSKTYPNNVYVSSKRYLEGIQISFDDFILHHIIKFDNKEILQEILKNKKIFEIIDLLPTKSLLPKYGSLEISIMNNGKIIKTLDSESLLKYFNVSFIEKVEDKYPDIPFTYEKKTSSQLNIKYIGGIDYFDEIEIKINLRKRLMNFESSYNPEEFGFTFPCGIIVIGKEYTITNYMYYNIPNVDVTMPFDIISLSWFVYGFMVVQILNIFLGKTQGKGLLENLKDRFVAKWGWVWGR